VSPDIQGPDQVALLLVSHPPAQIRTGADNGIAHILAGELVAIRRGRNSRVFDIAHRRRPATRHDDEAQGQHGH
jgi:hypothetical protein